MPVPAEYQRATDDFYKLLTDARDSAGLTTTNQAYTMVQGVLRVFRRRLDVSEAIRFLSVLLAGGEIGFLDFNEYLIAAVHSLFSVGEKSPLCSLTGSLSVMAHDNYGPA
jgi:hypothetical protein